jgi:adenosine deaminase
MTKINPNYPLVELHRHLDGAVRLETILDIGLNTICPYRQRPSKDCVPTCR